jgi:signal transduction histidine kinase
MTTLSAPGQHRPWNRSRTVISRWLTWLVQLFGVYWRIVVHSLKVNSRAPAWISPRWRHPLIGYLLAIVLTLLAITLEFAVVHVWLQVDEVTGILVFLVILFVGLNWGAGPCLVATALGTFLLVYVVYPPHFSFTLKQLIDLIQSGLVLFGGLIVTQVVSHRERERQRVQGVLETLLAMVEALVQPPAPASEGRGAAAVAVDGQAEAPPQDLVAQRLAEVLAYELEYQQVCLYALKAEGDGLTVLGAADRSANPARRWGEATLLPPLPSRVWRDAEVVRRLHAGEIVRIEGIEPKPPSEQRGLRSDSAQSISLLAIPLQRGATLLGVVTLAAPRPAAPAHRENLALVPAIAQLGALVIERERLVHEREVARAEALAQHEAARRLEGFLGIVSHELKTPLTGLLLGLQLIQHRFDRLVAHPSTPTTAATPGGGESSLPSVQQPLRHVYRQSKRLERLVNEVLESSRIETDNFNLRREPTDLAALVGANIEEVRLLTPERTIDVRPQPAQAVLVDGDRERIGQVLTNYLSNALKFSAEGRPVTVEVRLEGETARVAVTDEGPGLPPSEQERIWQRFYRAEGTHVQSGSGVGLGLGLYISKTIVEAHSGQVGVESAHGQGSTFWFTLPLAPHGETGNDTSATPLS